MKLIVRKPTNNKKIFQYSLEGLLIKEWTGIKNAAEFLKANASGLRETINKFNQYNNKPRTYLGFIWKDYLL